MYKAKWTARIESIISGYRNVERYVRTKLRTKSFGEEFEIFSSKKRKGRDIIRINIIRINRKDLSCA